MRSGWSVRGGALGSVSSSLQQRRPLVPGGLLRCGSARFTPATAATGTNWRGLAAPMPSRNARYSFSIASKCVLLVADQVHLVHAHDDLPDAEHRQDVAVAPAVLAHAFLGVDHQHRRLGARRARDHVLQELDVAGGVDDDVVARRALEEAARGVDRDALVLLVRERVQQERVLERLARALALALHRLQLSLRQRIRVGQQAPDHRALAVVDVADDDDVEVFALGRGLLN